ncbi:MAG: hypothetical protein Q4F54_01165 [Coriobacteriia bacterium]|nr:hypothetical protein [Coriobacteriia bacterium]
MFDPEISHELNVPYKIFKNYTSHSFAFYYFERGEGQSDCYCAFNLPTIPEGAIEVGKTVDVPESVHAQTEGKFYYKAQQ